MVYGYQQLPNQNINYGTAQNPAPQQQFGANVPVNNGNNNPYGQNFTAVDTQQLKQDAVQLSNKATEQVQENSQLGMAQQMFGIDFKNHPKRTAVSLALVLTTVVSLAVLGNSKLSTEIMPNLGHAVDDILKNNKLYGSISGVLTKAKNNLTSFLRKNKTIDNIFNTLKNNKAKAKWQMAKGGGTGARRIFEVTPPDTVKTALDFSDITDAAGEIIKDAAGNPKRHTSTINVLKKLFGDDKTAAALYDTIKNGENDVVCKKITESIAKNFGCMDAKGNIDKRSLDIILHQIKNGKITGLDGKLSIDVSELTDIVMDSGFSKAKGPMGKVLSALQGVAGAWWPANAINKVIDILHLPVKHIGRGNFGDALIKYNVVSGNLADTKLGSLVQKSLLVPTESISNFVNDKSGMGVMISLMALTNLYNNVQDAPKEKKVATIADDLISGVGSFTVTMPMAFGATYGLASLANMATRKEGGGLMAGPLRMIGKFFGMGLDPVKNGVATPKALPFKNAILNTPVKLFRGVKGLGGAGIRFILVTGVFSAIFMKPIRSVIHKIFGKPYDPAEEQALKAQQAQAEALKNLNMTEEQMMQKLQAHPEFVQALQNDPQTMAAIEQNPALLLQMIAALPDISVNQPVNGQPPAKPQGFNTTAPHSQMLDSYLNNPNNRIQPKAPSPQITPQPATQQPASQTPAEPVRTYIPSSDVNLPQEQAPAGAVQEQAITNPNVQAVMAKADKAMDDAMKFLG